MDDHTDVSTSGNASGIEASGDSSASAFAGGTLSGTVSSSQGEVDVSALSTINVTVNAGTDANVEGLGVAQADVTSGGNSFVVALAALNSTVHAGGDADLFAGGDLQAGVVAGGNVLLECIGDLTGSASAGQNLQAAAYGNLAVTNLNADGDVTLLWTRGDITGGISAGGNIEQVVSYGDIGADFSATNIVMVESFGPIGGAFTATVAIDTIESGGDISAQIYAPSVGAILQHVLGLLTDWPATPTLSAAPEIAAVAEGRAELQSLADQMAADKTTDLAALPGDKTAAAPSFQVSIGDLAAASAWFQNTATQLAAQIASWQTQDQQSLTSAQTALLTFFASETGRLAQSQAGNQADFKSLSVWLEQIVTDREQDAEIDEALGKIEIKAAQDNQAKIIAQLNYQRDNVWPWTFETKLLNYMLDRLQNVLTVAGILDPTPISDGLNAVISFWRGDLWDAGINAVSMIPYIGDLAKTGKLGKFADDGLAALRRVAGDFLGTAAKAAGYTSTCQLAASLGAVGRAAGKLGIVGCFGADTEIVMADVDPEIAGFTTGVESALLEEPFESRWLWATLIVGVGIAADRLANRVLRKRMEREKLGKSAVDCLFAHDEVHGDGDSLDELAAARHEVAPWSLACFDLALTDTAEFADALPTGSRVSPSAPNHKSRSVRYDASQPQGEFAVKTAVSTHSYPISRRAKAKPPRSRFGLIVLLCTLGLGAWFGFAPSAARPRHAEPLTFSGYVGSTTVPTAARISQAPRTKRIADVRVGDRVKADNPTGEEDLSLGAEVDPATWRKLVLRASKLDGSCADVELLRPLSWIEERTIGAGGTAPISVPECGIDGDAEVLAIEPCPSIMPGRGRVVTGTFHHSSAHVMELHVDGLDAPIVTTVNHLFWSADRRDYVRADALSRGEHLSALTAFMSVTSVVQLDRAIPVYNLEVHGAHVYHVSTAGILVHNSASLDDCIRLATKNINSSGTTVLGSFPGYITKANARGASFFDIGRAWDALSPAQRWAANKHFLDAIAARGDRVLLSIPKGDVEVGTYLAKEIEYLIKQKGYRWINQWALAKP